MGKHIRRAQAIEVFRSSFVQTSNTPVSISLADVDEILVEAKVRPSALLGAFSVAGSLLGVASALSPIRSASDMINKIVDEAASLSLNDSIREITLQETEEELEQNKFGDVKDTIKYHRDVRLFGQQQKSHLDNDSNSPENDEQEQGQGKTIQAVHETLRTGLSTVLRVSDVI